MKREKIHNRLEEPKIKVVEKLIKWKNMHHHHPLTVH